jgi:hypothetical protein
MKKLYDTKVPQEDLSKVSRLLSKDGISYFGANSDASVSKDMIDLVDPSLRILCHLLQPTSCKIRSFFEGIFFTKEQLKEIWNLVKKEEKVIRGTGLPLKQANGAIVTFQDAGYRTYWPSMEGFIADYPSACQKGWLVIDVPSTMKEQVKKLKDSTNLFGLYTTTAHSVNSVEYDTFTIKVDARESSLMEAEWRRITEVLVLLLVTKAELAA